MYLFPLELTDDQEGPPARVSTLSPISGRLAGDMFGLENANPFLVTMPVTL
jgi:hypothetical protein